MVGSVIQDLEIAMILYEPKEKCVIISAEVLSHKEGSSMKEGTHPDISQCHFISYCATIAWC